MLKQFLAVLIPAAIAALPASPKPTTPVHPTKASTTALMKHAVHVKDPTVYSCGGWDDWYGIDGDPTIGFIDVGDAASGTFAPSCTSTSGYFTSCTGFEIDASGFVILYTADTTQSTGLITVSDGLGNNVSLVRDPTTTYGGLISLLMGTPKSGFTNCPV